MCKVSSNTINNDFAVDIGNEKVSFFSIGSIGNEILNKIIDGRNIIYSDMNDVNFYELDFMIAIYEDTDDNSKFINALNMAKCNNVFSIIITNKPCSFTADMVIHCCDTYIDAINIINTIYDLVYNPGVINIDAADIKNLAVCKNSFNYYRNIVQIGNNEFDIMDNAAIELIKPLKTRLAKNSASISSSAFCILGSSNMSLFDLNNVCVEVEENALNDADLVFGFKLDLNSANNIYLEIGMIYSV